MPEENKLTSREAAIRLGSSRGTINNWCRAGRFPNAEKLTSPTGEDYWLIPESDLHGVVIKMGRPRNPK